MVVHDDHDHLHLGRRPLRLIEAAGFVFDRQTGSHRIYRRAGLPVINVQPAGSMAKGYQVKQVVKLIETHQLEVL